MALYQNGILISGANKLPQMTYAEWQALPAAERPSEWICTDRSYSDLPASDVTYDNTESGLSADNVQDAIDEVAQSGGSGGHTIQNASGVNMPQENTMQFTDSHVSDDSTNEKTVIENIKSLTEAQFESATEDGLYDVDVEGAEIGEISEDYVEVTADGNKTWETLLNELRAEIDLTKITIYSVLTYNGDIYSALYIDNNTLAFSSSGNVSSVSGGVPATVEMLIRSSSSQCFVISGTTATDVSSNKPSSGTIFTLYYGNDKAVVDLQTTANRCLMPDGTTTVAQAIGELNGKIAKVNRLTYTVTTTALANTIGGNEGQFYISQMTGYSPAIEARTIAHNVISTFCTGDPRYLAVVSIADNGSIIVNSSLAANYEIIIEELYI